MQGKAEQGKVEQGSTIYALRNADITMLAIIFNATADLIRIVQFDRSIKVTI